MAQSAGRVTCPRCGANNFNTVTACWKCGTALASAAGPQAASAPTPVQASPYTVERSPASFPPATPVSYAPSMPLPDGDTGMAKRAAIALALTIPFLGLPIGWVFMMIEDRRKQSIGRLCATWSLVGLLIHLVGMYVLAQMSVPIMMRLLGPAIDSAARRSAGSGGDGGLGGGLSP